MKRWLPSPWLSSAIFVGWLLLARSVTAGQLLLALLAAIAVPRLTRALRPTPRPLRRWAGMWWSRSNCATCTRWRRWR